MRNYRFSRTDPFNPIELGALWESLRNGDMFEVYKRDKYSFKLRTRQVKDEAELLISNDLHEALLQKDNTSFIGKFGNINLVTKFDFLWLMATLM